MSPANKILTEDVISLTEARDEIQAVTRRRVEKSTITRWIHAGCSGTKLEAVRIGGTLLTSKQVLSRFIEARTQQLSR